MDMPRSGRRFRHGWLVTEHASRVAGQILPGHASTCGVTPRRGVSVVGSANVDFIVDVGTIPGPGETLLASGYAEHAGGKGLNQAIASARTASTSLIATIGDDEAGTWLRSYARSKSVDVTAMCKVGMSTGRAFITLLPGGDNTIVVAALANAELTAEMTIQQLDLLAPAIVLVQFEIAEEAVRAAIQWTDRNSARVLINPSPVREISEELLRLADPLIVNEGEAAALVGMTAPAAELAQMLAARCRSVVVTTGGAGAVVASGRDVWVVPVPKQVKVKDSSGAGDEFAGSLAAALANGVALVKAVAEGVSAATHTVARSREER